MNDLLSVYWLFASTWLLIWVGLVLAQGTKGKEIRKPIQYCNSLVLEERNFLVRLAYKSCWNSSKH